MLEQAVLEAQRHRGIDQVEVKLAADASASQLESARVRVAAIKAAAQKEAAQRISVHLMTRTPAAHLLLGD